MGITRLLTFLSLIWAALALERTLIVYDSDTIDLLSPPSDLKQLVDYMKLHDHEPILRGYTDDDLMVFAGDETVFQHLVLLPTQSKKIVNKEQLNKLTLLKFMNKGGNLVVIGDSQYNYPDDIREFLNEVGIYPSPKNYKLVDHFTPNDKAKISKENVEVEKIVSTIDLEYDGQTAMLNNNENLIPIIKGSKTSFSSNDKINPIDNDNTWGMGEHNYLMVTLQALNNARLTWMGSSELFTEEVKDYAFSRKNVVKLQFVQHYKNDEPQSINKTLYRIKDQVIYTIGVSELVDNEWKPFVVKNDEDQLQLSFKMLDPYQRLNLEPLGEASSTEDGPLDCFVYYANFTVPDQHGMFTFELDYKRPGLSYLLDKKVVAVRHLANDEYKRSWDIPNSWFYVISAVFVVIGWFLFVVNFLYIGKTNTEKKNI